MLFYEYICLLYTYLFIQFYDLGRLKLGFIAVASEISTAFVY